MNSFYGGINGAPFKISQIFKSVTYDKKIETTQETSMLNDLEKRWQSNIGIDEYVLVSYGLPTDKDSYDKYLNIDKANSEKNYNGTLWQKVYEENDSVDVSNIGSINGEQYENIIFVNGSNKGFGYKLIASFAGQTPYFSIRHIQREANEEHYVELDFENNAIDRPILTFYEPKAWQFNDKITQDLEANEQITAEFYATNSDLVKLDDENTPHSNKMLEIHLSKPWDFTSDLQTDLEASENATMNFYGVDEEGQETDNPHSTKKLEIHLPKAWEFEKAEDVILTADQKPKVEFEAIDENEDNPGHSKKRFTFSLPEPWDIAQDETEYISPLSQDGSYQDPDVNLITDNETSTKTLKFTLPHPIQVTASQKKAKTRGDTNVTATYSPEGIDFEFAIYDPQDLDIREPIGPFSSEKLWTSYWEEDLVSWLNENQLNINQNAILPVTYNMIGENGNIIKSDSYWVYKTEQNEDGTWNWYYSQFGGVELINERVDDEALAENTTYSAKMINAYLDEVDKANEALNAIRTSWSIYYDEDIEKMVMMNVTYDYDANHLINVNGAGTSMTGSLDPDDPTTLIIDYPTI